MAKQVKGNAGIKPKLARKEYEKELWDCRPNSAICRNGSNTKASASSLSSKAATVLERVAPLRQSQSA